MATITEIKRKILELPPASFQELGDELLKKHRHGTLHSLGIQSGKGNTTKGTPDSYFRQENGKYVFVEYTTQQKGLFQKLRQDIIKCLDSSKTGLLIESVAEIICCHTSSNLKAGEDKKLHDLCEKQGVTLTLLGIDEIANQIREYYPSLAKDYLGLNISTNQILSVDEFIAQYDRNSMLAPLKMTFLYRENEKAEIMAALDKAPIVVVAGKAGVGKTRLVLETAREVANAKGYTLLCVKNKNLSLYEDLVSATEQVGSYLFFIDDANELAEIERILDYTTKGDCGYNVKVIVTVRDYAKAKVFAVVKKYAAIQPIEIEPFSDNEIEGFLKSNLNIYNVEYIKQIIRIAEGNPRHAYMAGKMANEKQSLLAIQDVSQLYDEYYGRYITETLSNNEKLCFTAGILSVVNAVLLDNLSVLQELLNNYGITIEDFRSGIRELSNLEVVEIHLNQVATLSDQCFANYMLHYVFFEKKLIPFSVVLEIGYKYFRNGVMRAFNTICNLFDSDATRKYYSKEVQKVWANLEKTKDPCYNDFTKDFHVFRPTESFLLARQLINDIPSEKYDASSVDFSKNRFCDKEGILAYLSGYQYSSEHLQCVMEILLEYCSKTADTLVSGYTWLKNSYGVRASTSRGDYGTQCTLSDCLYRMILKGNNTAKAVGFHWAEYLLGFSFHYSEMGRKNSVILYTMKIKRTEGIFKYRDCCWEILIKLASDQAWHVALLRFLYLYASKLSESPDYDIVSREVKYVEGLLSALNCNQVIYLKTIQTLLLNGEKINVQYDKKWAELLSGGKWELYQLLEDDFRSSSLEHEEYQNKRMVLLAEYGKACLASDMPSLVQRMNDIMSDSLLNQNGHPYCQGFEVIVQQFDSIRMQAFMDAFIQYGGGISISPVLILGPLNKSMEPSLLLSRIKNTDFPQKNVWLFSFFETLPFDEATPGMLKEWLLFLRDDSDKNLLSSSYRSLRVLDKFLRLEPNIYPISSAIIFEKRKYNAFIVRIYFEFLFCESIYSPEELLFLFQHNLSLLQDIYFYLLESDNFSDLNGTFLITFLSQNEGWLQRYTELLLKQAKGSANVESNKLQNSALWKSDNYEKYFDSIFDAFSKTGNPLHWPFCTFLNLLTRVESDDIVKQHQETWLHHIIIKNISSDDKLVAIFDFLCELDEDVRRSTIKLFLEHNRDAKTFERLTLVPNYWGVSNSVISIYQDQIDFLKSLEPLVTGSQFLYHKHIIERKIDKLQGMIERESVEEIYSNLYM